jgi:hypothetical protein
MQVKGADMAQSQNQRLRRMAEKAARRKVIVAEKRRAEAAAAAVSERLQILDAAKAPDFACFSTETLFDVGMGWVVAARYLPSGLVAASFFLVDAWFLGVRDAFFAVSSQHKFEEQMRTQGYEHPLKPMDPPVARKLLRDAAAYAASNGVPPNEDFAEAELIFGDVPMAEQTFTFGMEDKPLYIAGPNDTAALMRRMMIQIAKETSPEDFDATVEVDSTIVPSAGPAAAVPNNG